MMRTLCKCLGFQLIDHPKTLPLKGKFTIPQNTSGVLALALREGILSLESGAQWLLDTPRVDNPVGLPIPEGWSSGLGVE